MSCEIVLEDGDSAELRLEEELTEALIWEDCE